MTLISTVQVFLYRDYFCGEAQYQFCITRRTLNLDTHVCVLLICRDNTLHFSLHTFVFLSQSDAS